MISQDNIKRITHQVLVLAKPQISARIFVCKWCESVSLFLHVGETTGRDLEASWNHLACSLSWFRNLLSMVERNQTSFSLRSSMVDAWQKTIETHRISWYHHWIPPIHRGLLENLPVSQFSHANLRLDMFFQPARVYRRVVSHHYPGASPSHCDPNTPIHWVSINYIINSSFIDSYRFMQSFPILFKKYHVILCDTTY